MQIRYVLIILGLAILAALAVLFRNPLNVGTARSSRFSDEAFGTVQEGDQIEEVILLMGEPLITVAWEDCGLDPCTNYVFADEPTAWWVVSYYKAWVLVSANGRVIRTIKYREP